MRVTNWMKVSMFLAGLCLAGLPIFAQQQQSSGQQQASDPVADAARKAREQQKTAPKPKKVYTDDDIKPAAPSSEAPAATGQASGSEAAAGKAQGAAAKGGDSDKESTDPETIWRKRFAAQREKIATAEKELDILQREDDKAQVQYYSDPQKALMQQNTRQDINDKTAKIDQKKQEIANLKQQLSDMEDELRKSGGDPGWAR
jgi:chromosome segregation ATPase